MFIKPLLLALKYIPHAKYEKKPIDNASLFMFFIRLDLILPKFCPKATPTLILIKYVRGFNYISIIIQL